MCKMEHFGNCDPETADREYCIFHKPNKDEKDAVKFYTKFLEEFRPRVEEIKVDKKIKRLVFEKPVNAAGFVFPEIPDEPIVYVDENGNVWNQRFTFEYAIFEKGAIFYQSIFEGIISFSYATFQGRSYSLNEIIRDKPLLGIIGELITNEMIRDVSMGAVFDEADFLDIVIFENTTFKSNASFFRTKFRKGALFNWSKFRGELTVFSSVEFFSFKDEEVLDRMLSLTTSVNPIEVVIYSKLGIGVSFNGSEFKAKAMFDRTAFTGASFMDVHFLRESTFDNANFNGPAIFISSVFLEDTSFRKATFEGEATFSGSSLNWVQNLKPSLPMYEKINMPSAMFHGFVTFTEAEFNSMANFSRCHFKKGADFGNVKFNADVNFQWSVFMEENLSIINGNYQLPETTFAHSRFKGRAHFNFATFGKVIFNFVRFLDPVGFQGTIFNGHLHIREAVFEDVLAFSAHNFVDVDIEGSRFQGAVIFSGAKLTGDFRIVHSTFEREVLFGKGGYKEENYSPITFSESVKSFIIERTTFEDSVSFRDIEFQVPVKIVECSFNSHVYFDESVFKNICDLSGNFFKSKTSFKDTIFEGDVIFDRCLLSGIWDFAEKQNRPYKFYKSLSFDGVSISGTVSFVSLNGKEGLEEFDTKKFEGLFNEPRSKIEAARIQRISLEREGKRDEADRMFVLEMRAKRKLRLEQANGNSWNAKIRAKTINFFEWLLGDLPSEYGTSLERIAIAVVAVVVLFGFLYWLTLVSNIVGITSVFVIISLLISIWYYQTFDTYPDKLAETLRFPVGLIMIIGMLYTTVSPKVDPIIARPGILLSNGTAITPTGGIGNCLGTLLNALYYSLVTFTTLGYGDMHPTGWLKALSAIEALTGAVFMALIVAVIARKWMR
ncbi:hypothetical protein FH039_10600 [Thermococcus indicus]|uniref:Potassium channel domain-containing protein n=1 Tax=Thermococcus indicus TaxID=2586643 RepID=A0A4Y5SM54_9EURY|nr:pentapeptide repeat-containing protein [Thermococcus indicus]QDA31966.1 hypothetical protein FH039_10600 [Thermococcus indicus]